MEVGRPLVLQGYSCSTMLIIYGDTMGHFRMVQTQILLLINEKLQLAPKPAIFFMPR